jgi:plasmid stabilization system protein ParE
MARRVKWTEVAWSDLEAVADYIARDSRRYAAAFVREVRDAARSLTCLAERGRRVPEFGMPAVRELFVRKYRLIYRLTEDTVHIVAFIHGARDLAALWEQERRNNPEDIA